MNKILKTFLLLFLFFLTIVLGILCAFFIVTADCKLDESKLISTQKTIVLVDDNGNVYDEISNDVKITSIEDIPSHVKNAFIAIEDRRFYSHNGIDRKALFRALIKNVQTLSFKEGGSTISQQLIKNTHLSNEKTLKRKLNEIRLTKKLEKKYNKKQILETYLNTIYFGENCYGITSASNHYFNKSPKDLTIDEGAILACIIKAPSNYSPSNNSDACKKRRDLVLQKMLEEGYINTEQFNIAISKSISVKSFEKSSDFDFNYLVKNQVKSYLENNVYSNEKIIVYTTLKQSLQNYLKQSVLDSDINTDKSAILIDNAGKIRAYYSTCGEIYRQMGSTAKPFLVYAPALEENVYDSCSIILDEKTDFNGYSPKNYNDVYYGNVSLKKALAKSLNVCSVKILQTLGVDKAINYAKKLNLKVCDEDKNLSLALGSTLNGATLKEITACYTPFICEGYYVLPTCIEKICNQNGDFLYLNNKNTTKVFSDDTAYITSDMLNYTVKEGTAKKLSFLDFNLYAKTGTVGNKDGNTDAYCISYTGDYILGTWLGNKDNTLMPNSITGGNQPASISYDMWSKIYKNSLPSPIKISNNVVTGYLDKISYDSESIIELADDNAPKRYVIEELFRKSSLLKNKSTRFSTPKIENAELFVKNNEIILRLCQAEYINVVIYRENNGKKTLVFDTKKVDNKTEFIDRSFSPNTLYTYYAIPYFIGDKKEIFGDEIFIGSIKTPSINIDGEWWNEEID